ncbi:hypothetical protein PJL15_03615 [Paenarthrobacter nitroguajacolicus]|nr:hypothetical protein [Paenarthrobacter nitroguajacolicus]
MEAQESVEATTFGFRFGPPAHSIRSVANARPPAGAAEPTAPSALVDHINYKSIVRYATSTHRIKNPHCQPFGG